MELNTTSHRRWLPIGLAAGLSAFLVFAYWKDKAAAAIGDRIRSVELEATARFIGKPIPGEFQVSQGASTEAVSLADIVRPSSLVVVWTAGCDACASLLAHYQSTAKFPAPGEIEAIPDQPQLFLLARASSEAPPAGVPAAQFLRPASEISGTPFAGRMVPVIWRVDEKGRLMERHIGYESFAFDRLLAQVSNDSQL